MRRLAYCFSGVAHPLRNSRCGILPTKAASLVRFLPKLLKTCRTVRQSATLPGLKSKPLYRPFTLLSEDEYAEKCDKPQVHLTRYSNKDWSSLAFVALNFNAMQFKQVSLFIRCWRERVNGPPGEVCFLWEMDKNNDYEITI